MELTKIRNLSDDELEVESRKTAEQLFRLRFQLTMGQVDVLKKVRILRKDVARIQTVVRERELGLRGTLNAPTKTEAPAVEEPAVLAADAEPKVAKKSATKKAVSVKTARKSTAAKPESKRKTKSEIKKEAR